MQGKEEYARGYDAGHTKGWADAKLAFVKIDVRHYALNKALEMVTALSPLWPNPSVGEGEVLVAARSFVAFLEGREDV